MWVVRSESTWAIFRSFSVAIAIAPGKAAESKEQIHVARSAVTAEKTMRPSEP